MSLTKEQILSDFSLMDLARLQKLHDYSSLLIIPDEDLLVNVTMRQMLDKVFLLADSLFPEWTDRSHSDFGRFLAELMCLFSEKDFWYINAYATETDFSRIVKYSEGFSRAVSLGYEPGLCKGSTATFEVTFAPGGSSTIYKRGQLVLSFPNGSLKFTNDDEFTVPASGSPVTMPLLLHEGLQVNKDASYNGHNIFLDREMIDVESIAINVSNLQWSRVRGFGRSVSNSSHFIVLPEENGTATVYFGEDGYGITPAVGVPVRMQYRVTKGALSNMTAAADTSVNSSLPTRIATAAVMITDATGGSNAETLASIKNNVPLYFSSKKAAINSAVTQQLLNAYPEVKKSYVTSLSNVVFFRVIPVTGVAADALLLATLQERLSPFIMLGYSCMGVTTDYVDVSNVELTAYLLQGYPVDETKTLIRQLVIDYTDPLVLANYGKSFDLTDLSLLIRSRVPGVQNVVFNQVASAAPANIVVQASEILKKLNTNQTTVNISVI